MNGDVPRARILVVDDAEANRYVLAAWLRRAGHEVVEARTGREALAKADEGAFDLVVLDVHLPDMSGYAVCERLKSMPRTQPIPVLHVSATAVEATDRSEGLRRGAEGYLVEPLEREELLATVEALLRAADAQRTALQLASQLRRLNEATQAVNDAGSLEELIVTIGNEAATLFEGAVVVAVAVTDCAMKVTARAGSDPAITSVRPRDLDALRESAESGILAGADAPEGFVPVEEASYYCARLDDGGSQRGILLVEVTPLAARSVPADQTQIILSQYARAATTAIRNMRTYDIERSIALTLQRSLLPAPSHIPGLDIVVGYEASTEHAEVGGDFYDIFPLREDQVVIAIGDVAGHSLEAATVMAQLRMGIRSHMLEGHGPSETIAHLNRLLRAFHPDMIATVCCGLYDRRTGLCRFANAGHLPPLVISQGGASYLPIGTSLIGVDNVVAPIHECTLEPGDVLLLFTDGLIERRSESISSGLERLLQAATTMETDDLKAFCEHVMHEAGPSRVVDDIALVAVRRY